MTIHEPGWYPDPSNPRFSVTSMAPSGRTSPRHRQWPRDRAMLFHRLRHHHKSSAVIHARCSAGPSWLGCAVVDWNAFRLDDRVSGNYQRLAQRVPDGRARECYGGRTDRPDSRTDNSGIGITRLTNTSMPRIVQRSPIIAGLGAAVVLGYDYHSIQQWAQSINSTYSLASVGPGFWVCCVGEGSRFWLELRFVVPQSRRADSQECAQDHDTDALLRRRSHALVTETIKIERAEQIIADFPTT